MRGLYRRMAISPSRVKPRRSGTVALVTLLTLYMVLESYMTLGKPVYIVLVGGVIWLAGLALMLLGRPVGLYPFFLGSIGFLEWRLMTLNRGEEGLLWLAEVSVAVILWFIATLEGLILWMHVRRPSQGGQT